MYLSKINSSPKADKNPNIVTIKVSTANCKIKFILLIPNDSKTPISYNRSLIQNISTSDKITTPTITLPILIIFVSFVILSTEEVTNS